MTRSKYLKLLLTLLTPEQIKLSAENPTPYMSKTHIKLHYIALKQIQGTQYE